MSTSASISLLDTIAAIATPIGEAGLALVRLSGPESISIADRCFRPAGLHSKRPSDADSHTVHYGHIQRNNQILDEVLLTVLRSPRTFTREDTIEIACHGGMLTTQLVLQTVLEQGARLAQPGEFTKRAFLNGRLDLAQAEAVADLIHARTEKALTLAQEQLSGHLSRRINDLRDKLISVLAHVEAHIDFPDEDIHPDTQETLQQRLRESLTIMDQLLTTAREGEILRRGIRIAIVGRPNAGKSSLLNQLVGHDRAIVSPSPGTTRDTIEAISNIRGIPAIFIDTAGLRHSNDPIELEGIRRTRETLACADLVLHVIARDEPLHPDDFESLHHTSATPRIMVANKCDLPSALDLPTSPTTAFIPVSCITCQGIEELKDVIRQTVSSGTVSSDMTHVMINVRHEDALRRARTATETTLHALQQGLSLELAALDLHIAVNAVGEIVGKTTTEDLLDSIFSQFCLGK